MALLDNISIILQNDCKLASMTTSFIIDEQSISGYPRTTITNSSGRVLLCRFYDGMTINPNIAVDIFPYFTTNPGNNLHRKMCDYIIFYERPIEQNKLFIFLLELKSRNLSKGIHQILAGYNFAKFIVETAKRTNSNSNEDTQYTGMMFTLRDIAKYPEPKEAYKIYKPDLLVGEHPSGFGFPLDFILPRPRL